MKEIRDFREKIFYISDNQDFEPIAMDIFRLQAAQNPMYGRVVKAFSMEPGRVKKAGEIPFLPAEFFKTQQVIIEGCKAQQVFESSGTTGIQTAKHFIADDSLYQDSVIRGFEYFFGHISQYCILALVPERINSSLVHMLHMLIRASGDSDSGFYYSRPDELTAVLQKNASSGRTTILFGITYALLDYSELFPLLLRNTIVVETGGMKGKRKEMTRQELHGILCSRFGVPVIHSEYGMTEILSQAWSKGGGIYSTPPWMKVHVQDLHDPRSLAPTGVTGIIRIIDLANLYSCSFITTGDLGRMHPDGTFEVLGRATGREIRGCNLMTQI